MTILFSYVIGTMLVLLVKNLFSVKKQAKISKVVAFETIQKLFCLCLWTLGEADGPVYK